MTINDQKVSVIIPVFNGEKYLTETLQSVLEQTYNDIEIIVVDDGSTDNTAKIIKQNREIKYIYQNNQGTAAAFNQGIKFAAGKYFSFLGADDLWLKNKTKLQIEAFKSIPDQDIITGHVQQFLSPELPEQMKNKIKFSEELIPGHVIPAMLIKKDFFFKVGLFETKWKVGAEMSWFLRAKEYPIKIKTLPDLVLRRRIHTSNKGIKNREFISQRAKILKASLDRKRNKK
ncbi:MAG: glycosyltransferase [Planctomycetia bacterium]|nr:glycosyltransferase [Planctomycetia bacterium]